MIEFYQKIKDELGKQVSGKDSVIELILIAALCDGHVLLEGLPGTAKTTIANNFAKVFDATFTRIQFTPDILPSDIVGTHIFNQKLSNFEFKPGPIFGNIVLADEINRAPPKTQAALLECMAERQVTVDGTTFVLEPPFMVIATQNPIEMEGTYPLPEAQLDRFLFKVPVTYPTREEEYAMLMLKNKATTEISRLFRANMLVNLREEVKKVRIEFNLIIYILDIIGITRQSPELSWGASPRASIALINAAKAKAYLNGRDYVIPDDIKNLSYPILRHRLKMKESGSDAAYTDQFIWSILKRIPVPRVTLQK